MGATPTHVAVGAGAYWITNADADTVSRIDPASDVVIQTIPVGSSPSGITIGDGAVWVANSLDGTVSRIDPATNTVVQTIDVGNGPGRDRVRSRLVWVANTGDGTITRIDADSGTRTKSLPVAATDLAVGGGSLWASQRAVNEVARIDLSSGGVQPIGVGGGPTGVAVGGGAAWVANSLDGTVSRIDPSTNSVAATIPAVGDGPTASGRRRGRRLGEQPVRRHTRANRLADEQCDAPDQGRQPARRESRLPAARFSSASTLGPAPAIEAAR